MIEATLRVLTPDVEIERSINKIVSDHINKAVSLALPEIKARIQLIVQKGLEQAPEYASLINGQLQAELGLTRPEDALKYIVSIINSGLEITFTEMRPNIDGLISVELISNDYSDVLGAESLGGTPIPWLTWLLTAGDAIVVAQYNVVYQNTSGSRTGEALMVKSGQGYHIPPEFSGTIDNNWLIRSIIGLEPEFATIIEDEIIRRV